MCIENGRIQVIRDDLMAYITSILNFLKFQLIVFWKKRIFKIFLQIYYFYYIYEFIFIKDNLQDYY